MLKVLSTKLLDESLTDSAHAMGIDLTCEEFIRVLPLEIDMAELMSIQYDAMVFTSSNAVRCFFDNENIEVSDYTKPIYSISGKTKEELTDYSMEPVAIADNALQLADKILADKNIRSVLHICGNIKLDVLEKKLTASGVRYTPFTVCETLLNSILLRENYEAVMFFSPSGVDSFVMKNALDRDTLYCCIGDTTADTLRSINDKLTIILPIQPTPEAMLTLIKNYKFSTDI